MRLNNFLFTAATVAALASCQQDTLEIGNSGVDNSGLNGKLVKTGILGVGFGAGESETRAYSVDGQFIWMPEALESEGELTADRLNQRIGFCWTGINEKFPAYSAANSVTQKVYTNYEFEHVGWLDINAKGVETDPCDEEKIINGGYIVGEGLGEADWQTIAYNSTNGTGTKYQKGIDANRPYGTYEDGTKKLNLGNGLFRTDNADVFQGEYLVYFPYTDKFTRGQILATQPDYFDIDVAQNRFTTLSKYAFAVGRVDHYEGGQAVNSIQTRTLSSFAGVKLYHSTDIGNDNMSNSPVANIKKVIFYADEKPFFFEKDLDASKVRDAIMNGKALDQNVYYDGTGATEMKEDKVNAIYANLENTGAVPTATPYATVYDNTKENTGLRVYFPVLPQTVKGLKVVLVNEDDQTYTYNVPDDYEFTSTNDCAIAIDLADPNVEFVNHYMVVDEESFFSAMANIYDRKDVVKSINKVQLLRDVKIEKLWTDMDHTDPNSINPAYAAYVGNYGSLFYNKDIQIYSDCGADLILGAGQEMYIKNIKNRYTGQSEIAPVMDIDVDVLIEGAGCCETETARLSVGGAQGGNECIVNFNEIVTNEGALALGNVENNKAKIYVKELKNVYDVEAAKYDKAGEKQINAAKLFFLGKNTTYAEVSDITIDKLTNSGTIISAPTVVGLPNATVNWLDIVEANLPAGYAPDKRIVNVNIETLDNEVVTKKGTAPWGGEIEVGEYTLVTVNTALNNNTSDAVITTVGRSFSATDGRLDVKGSSVNEGTMDNQGVTNFTTSSLDNNGLFIDQLSGEVGGKPVNNGSGVAGVTKKVNRANGMEYETDLGYAGIYVSQVATVERMAFILSDAVAEPSTVVLEVMGCNNAFYNFAEYEKNMEDKEVYINAKSTIAFKAYELVSGVQTAVDRCFGHCVTVLDNNTLLLTDGLLNSINNVNVDKGAILNIRQHKTADATTVTVGGNLTNDGETDHNATKLTVVKNLYNTEGADFNTKSTFEVKQSVVTAGDFISEGTDNVVGQNFTQNGNTSLTTFEHHTTTTINGTFDCNAGQFERLALGGGNLYRATVNVNILGATTGSTNTAWPTEF